LNTTRATGIAGDAGACSLPACITANASRSKHDHALHLSNRLLDNKKDMQFTETFTIGLSLYDKLLFFIAAMPVYVAAGTKNALRSV
jgi:hypothetical protein